MASMILSDTKQLLGIAPDDTNFDLEITMHINSVIMILTQLGVGAEEGIIITGITPWDNLIGNRKDLEIVKSYIYQKVRLLFDPPQNSFLIASIEKQCSEYEWRIEVQASLKLDQTPPLPPDYEDDDQFE